MTFFEYQTILATIERSNYTQLRRLYTKLKDQDFDNFYSVHAINKTITKFKTLTTSQIIKRKPYTKGTCNYYFIVAIENATSKEEIVSLITDFSEDGNMYFELPQATTALIHLSTLLHNEEDCKILDKVRVRPNYYSVGQDNLFGKSLTEKGRLVPSILAYLAEIENTPLYNYLLNNALYIVKQGYEYNPKIILEPIAEQYKMHKKYTEALFKTSTLLTNLFEKDTE